MTSSSRLQADLDHEATMVELLWHWFQAFQSVSTAEVGGSGTLGVHHPLDSQTVAVRRCRDERAVVELRHVDVQSGHDINDAGCAARVGVDDADVHLSESTLHSVMLLFSYGTVSRLYVYTANQNKTRYL